jgi:tRNA wybutosine-synthesizing protein 3
MVYNFENSKKVVLEKVDKSSIGGWDKPILKLCNLVNENNDYYTTSSCSGRIALIIETLQKKPGLFLFRTHKKTTFNELKNELQKASVKCNEMIYFKQEPCVLTVSCRSVEKAQELVNLARLCAWKRSGLTTTTRKNIIELFGTEKIEMPIVNKGKILVDDDFLKLLVKESNFRMVRTWEKIKKLEKELSK